MPFRSIAQSNSFTQEYKLWIRPELRNVSFIFMEFCGSKLSSVSSGEHCRSDPVQVQSTLKPSPQKPQYNISSLRMWFYVMLVVARKLTTS